jgi:hypothetical protein
MARHIALFALIGLSACVLGNPATGQGPGAPLRLRVENEAYDYTTRDVVGASTITDRRSGNQTTIVHSRNRRHSGKVAYNYEYLQGQDPIDEQDYFRLAGDRVSFERVVAHRAKATRYQKIGKWLILGSLAASGAMIAGGLAADSKGLLVTGISLPYLPSIFGSVFIASGRSSMKARPLIPLATARRAAEEVEECTQSGCRPGRRN